MYITLFPFQIYLLQIFSRKVIPLTFEFCMIQNILKKKRYNLIITKGDINETKYNNSFKIN